jgi:hypothetical protein
VATGCSPFEIITGRKPQLFPSLEITSDKPSTLTAWLRKRENSWTEARDALWTSRVQQALQHNKRQRDLLPLKKGDWVLLDLADWRGRHQGGTDKLKERYEGPYRVTRVFNHGQDVELDLPEGYQRHRSLHISKIKQFHQPVKEDNSINTENPTPAQNSPSWFLLSLLSLFLLIISFLFFLLFSLWFILTLYFKLSFPLLYRGGDCETRPTGISQG